jgi:glutathione S-transferase
MNMTRLVINGQAPSNYVRSARMSCIEAGVDHELRPVADGSVADVRAALRSQAYRQKHPFARMPSLEDGDLVVFETSAIARYVSDRYGNGCLVPADPLEAVRMEQWVSAINCYVIPDTVQKFVAPFIFHDSPDLEAVERDKPILRAHYEIVDHALEGRTVLAGDAVSIADILLAPLLHAVGNLPGGMALFEGLPNLGRWWDNISARRSFINTAVPLPGRSEQAA